jgi:hypothetical protein
MNISWSREALADRECLHTFIAQETRKPPTKPFGASWMPSSTCCPTILTSAGRAASQALVSL